MKKHTLLFMAVALCTAAVLLVWTGTDAGADKRPPLAVESSTVDPATAERLTQDAEARFQKGDLLGAAELATKASRLDPKSARAHRVLGYLHASLGNDREAQADFEHAATLEPNQRVTLADYHLARAWAELQNDLRRRPPDAEVAERLRGLAALADVNPELKALLDSADNDATMPVPDLIPPLLLTDSGKQALVVEKRTQTARLYALRGGNLVALRTYPVTTGQATGNKEHRGDRRTPDGVYAITGLLPGKQLPDLYGDLAMPLSYPNAWDKMHEHDGDGIWIHGANRLNQPFIPRATKGCVVMRSEDLRELAHLIDPGITPVWITEEVAYRTAKEWAYSVDHIFNSISPDGLLAVVAGPDYTTVFRKEGESITRQFLDPYSPSKVITTEHTAAISPGDWAQQLAILNPQGAQTLRRVFVVDQDAFPAVVIETSGPVEARGFAPDRNDRFYIDLAGVRPGALPETVKGTGQMVKQIRIAAAEQEPPVTRVAVDLNRPMHYRISRQGNNTVVSLNEINEAR